MRFRTTLHFPFQSSFSLFLSLNAQQWTQNWNFFKSLLAGCYNFYEIMLIAIAYTHWAKEAPKETRLKILFQLLLIFHSFLQFIGTRPKYNLLKCITVFYNLRYKYVGPMFVHIFNKLSKGNGIELSKFRNFWSRICGVQKSVRFCKS